MRSQVQHKSKSSGRLTALYLVLLGLVLGFGGGYALARYTMAYGTPQGTETERVLVARVIDGDTIELADGRRVRYLGLDTPETVHPDKPVECYGPEASARNKELVEGKMVELQRGSQETDKFGRLLRYVYADGVFVNAELVAQGYARASIFDPDDYYSQVLVQLQQYARMRGQGLWAACGE